MYSLQRATAAMNASGVKFEAGAGGSGSITGGGGRGSGRSSAASASSSRACAASHAASAETSRARIDRRDQGQFVVDVVEDREQRRAHHQPSGTPIVSRFFSGSRSISRTMS